MKKLSYVLIEAFPVLLMIWLIPLVPNDYLLTLMYIALIDLFLRIKKEQKDALMLVLGFCLMTVAETIFVLTGVETFTRNSLFGLMPLWLPFLWAYSFVAMKREIMIVLGRNDG